MVAMPESSVGEDGRRRGGNAKTMLALIGYANTVDMLCYRAGIIVVKAASQSARKSFLGTARPKHPDGTKKDIKAEVLAECKRRGWDPRDHNEGDALCLLDHAHLLYFPDLYKRSYQR